MQLKAVLISVVTLVSVSSVSAKWGDNFNYTVKCDAKKETILPGFSGRKLTTKDCFDRCGCGWSPDGEIQHDPEDFWCLYVYPTGTDAPKAGATPELAELKGFHEACSKDKKGPAKCYCHKK